ncbi:cuticle protein 16.5-like isoform X2 [Anopheles darlingi]|uniref:cuticle protein 16.5-like n=1 Tax=Anopheles darlingi TaxID=43151 RepID=UPI00210049C5|nr:cuticle protein 16.5-like [Anopheles darlingi]XP_049533269.1 cuticle protein 16.5-like isoform X1 [Anopheles darlingi]XP_049533271.1 cuticle protein 16.5-like isoform X2 [Anopheles darlingi]
MKCIAVVVMVALAVVAECGIVHHAPVVYSAPETTVVQQNVAPKYVVPAPITYATHATSYAAPAISYAAQTVSYAAPAISYAAPIAYSAPTVVAQPAVAVVAQKEARYVVAIRGAIHEAPLAGHAVNQQSLNVEPAPGTL